MESLLSGWNQMGIGLIFHQQAEAAGQLWLFFW
jgi:hypothetical protein